MTASNENTHANFRGARPYLELCHAGDGRALARVLARVIVRQQLNFANLIGDRARCDDARAAG
jgi:hypothetical protein